MEKYSIKHFSGFTLIELLVVVLIIGSLAAVAVPQYNKAVIQSRFVQLKSAAQSIAAAQEIYYLANGHYADSLSKLDIHFTIDETDDNKCILTEGGCQNNVSDSSAYIYCYGNSKVNMNYQLFYAYSAKEANYKYCVARNTDLASPQNQICKKETGSNTPVPASDSTRKFWRYN